MLDCFLQIKAFKAQTVSVTVTAQYSMAGNKDTNPVLLI